MVESTLDWLIGWFAHQAHRDTEEIRGMTEENYFDRGLIDSFGIIELIADVEGVFEIRFSEEHFQDRRFATMKGLHDIIDELQRGGSS